MARDYAAEYQARNAKARAAGFDSYAQYRIAAKGNPALAGLDRLRGDARYTIAALATGKARLPTDPDERKRKIIDIAKQVRKSGGKDRKVFTALGSPPRKGK